MVSVDRAIKIIASSVDELSESEKIDIFNATGRVLFRDLYANSDVPSYNNSSMDGYALKSEDVIHADKNSPVILKISGENRTGHNLNGEILKTGNAVRIMTGAPIPDGADSVIPVEETEETGDYVKIFKKTEFNENVRFAGEDIKRGSIVLKKGIRLGSAETGIIASLNLREIDVFRKPRVAIFSTGDEIEEPGTTHTGKIINSNAYTIYSEVRKNGGDPVYIGIIRDNYDDILNYFSKLVDYDIIISSGGVSMGKYDFIPDIYRDAGIDILLEKVQIKPGKPLIFGKKGKQLYFGLPGNPASVMVSLVQFVRPALLLKGGCINIEKPLIKATLTEDIRIIPGRRNFLRGIFTIENGFPLVCTTGPQGSGILTSFGKSNCLIILPENIEKVNSGDFVYIQLTGHEEI